MGFKAIRKDVITCDRSLCDFSETVEPGGLPSAFHMIEIKAGAGAAGALVSDPKYLCRGCMDQFWAYMRNQPGGPGGDR